MKNIKKISAQNWIIIDEIYKNGIVKLKNKKYIKLLKIIPINYNLKSNFEKEAILNSYKIFLKTCNFDIQILIQSSKEDLSSHISKIKKNINKKENKFLEDISQNYIKYINKMNLNQKSSSKNFYIIISNKNNSTEKDNKSEEFIQSDLKEKYFKIKECLSRCGNSVIEISEKKEIEKIYYTFLNQRKSNNNLY